MRRIRRVGAPTPPGGTAVGRARGAGRIPAAVRARGAAGRSRLAHRAETDDDRGSLAAELAVALPAVVLTVVIGVGALGAAAQQVALQDAVADAARLLGRGEPPGAAVGTVTAAVAGARVSSEQRGDLSCVTARIDAGLGSLVRVPLRASSCALSGGL